MSYGGTPQVSTVRLLTEATDWLVAAVEREGQHPVESEHLPTKPVGRRAKLNDRIEGWLGARVLPERRAESVGVEAPVSVDRRQVGRIAEEYLARGVDGTALGERSSAEVVEVICREWGHPEAAPLAHAWLRDDDRELKGVHMDTKWVVVLIGAAAGAAVLALVLHARRNSSVEVHGRDIRVSEDFSALQRVRDRGGHAAEIAGRVIDSESSPWDFSLEQAVRRLSTSDKRTLLSALAPLDVGVEVIRPGPGEAFVAGQMSSARVVADGSAWVVAAAPPESKVGFRLRGRTEVPAEVEACTADWWCLALADAGCPVAAAVRGDPERYVGLEAEYAACWSVVQGFSGFADPRADFDENTLASWSERLRERLSRWYSASSGRLPVNFGAVGDRYDASVMRPVDAAPEADARVVAVEGRDGLPQLGLGCVGAPPLLYAVVRVEEG